ncbi:unnamed protein product, partial [Ectocarpus sp. 12 AP-2014]
AGLSFVCLLFATFIIVPRGVSPIGFQIFCLFSLRLRLYPSVTTGSVEFPLPFAL